MEFTEQNFFIPLPPFDFHLFIQEKANKFCGYPFNDPWSQPQTSTKKVDSVILDFLPEHRIQFLGHLINYTIESFKAHDKICRRPNSCKAESGAQEVLYYLYKELKDLGVRVDFNSFTTDEIANNNILLSDIDYTLSQIIASDEKTTGNQEIINAIENLRIDLSSMREQYAFGKKKWYQTLTGIITEYSFNKSLDFVLVSLSPKLTALYHIIKLLLGN